MAAALLALAGTADGALQDVPVAGRTLRLSAHASNAARRSLSFRSARDTAIVPPFADPADGASLLVFASNGVGQCRAEIALPAQFWKALRNDGPNSGWRYRDRTGSAGGIRSVVLKARAGGGQIIVQGRGAGLPCGLAANAQKVPVRVVLRLGDTRYCAAFGGRVTRNVTGRFRASGAAAPASCPDADVTVANLNVLHGLFCPAPTAFCRLNERIPLLAQWLVERGCPDVVALQEVFDVDPTSTMLPVLAANLPNACSEPYNVIYFRGNGADDSYMLSRHPVLFSAITPLYGGFRNVLLARVDHPIGRLDLFSTHLASGSDLGGAACGTLGACPPECVTAGAATVRDCQAVQLALLVEALHDVASPALVMGDFNRSPGSFVYNQFTGRGWTDLYLAAGNPECVPATGVGCTSGRSEPDDLESPALNVDERIDFIFLVPPGPASLCSATPDPATDDDGDGTATRLFADLPNPFAPSCGPLPDPICWVSDHTGVEADVNCD